MRVSPLMSYTYNSKKQNVDYKINTNANSISFSKINFSSKEIIISEKVVKVLRSIVEVRQYDDEYIGIGFFKDVIKFPEGKTIAHKMINIAGSDNQSKKDVVNFFAKLFSKGKEYPERELLMDIAELPEGEKVFEAFASADENSLPRFIYEYCFKNRQKDTFFPSMGTVMSEFDRRFQTAG